jgi:uncharacterized protein YukE
MPDVQLDIDQLLNDVVLLTDEKLGEIDVTMQSVCNTVGTLTIIGWDGRARDEFIEKFSDFKKDMRLFYENLNALNNCLRTAYRDGEQVYIQGNSLLDAL